MKIKIVNELDGMIASITEEDVAHLDEMIQNYLDEAEVKAEETPEETSHKMNLSAVNLID